MTVRDKTGLASQIADLLADNNTGDISEADIRSIATDIVESMALDTSVPDVDDLVESVTLSGTTVTVTKQDGTTSTFETPDSVAANRLVPGGGTDGQVLTKASGDDYDADWEDAGGLDLADQNRLNAVPGLEAKTADLSIEETGRTWSEVAAVADGGFATHANANTLSSAQAEALTYSASRNATGTDAGRFFTLLRIPSGEDVRDFRVVQTGDLGTFYITNWHTIGTTTGGFTYAYSQHNLFEGYAVTVEQETSTTTTHFRGEADAENVAVDASGFGTNLGSGDTDVQAALATLDGLTLGADPIAEFSSRAYSRGELAFTGTGTAFTVWVADQAIGANSTEPTRAHPRNWLPVAGPGAIRGLLSDINTNVLRRGDIFWLEELNDPQKVYFTRTAGTYTTEADLTDPDNVIELTDGAAAVSAHNTSGTAHNDIRSDVSTVEDRLDALDPVEIEAYDSTATYSRGSANSIVTHSSGLFVYISSTERSSNHDPDTQPGYWLKLSEGVGYEVITSGSHRIAARTIIVDGNNDNVYICTTTQTTPRDLTHIAEQAASTGGTFILLNGAGSGGGGFTLRQGTTAPASGLGDDGDWYLRTSNGQWYEKVSGAWVDRYTDQLGDSASGITQTQGDARYARQSENLDDLDSASTARTNLGLGDAAERHVGLGDGNIPELNGDGDLPTAVIPTAIARLNSPALTGTPTAPTPPAGNDSTRIATTAYVQDEKGASVSDAGPADVGTAAAEGTSADASRADHVHQLPINETLEYASNQFGVNTQRVVQTVSEWVQHFATGDSHDTSGHTGKYQEYTSADNHRRIGSVQYDFDPQNDSAGGGTGKTYRVYIIELTGRNVDAVLGISDAYSGNNLQHRFHFADGVMINPNVRIGIGLHRTDGGGNNYGLSVRSGNESQDSPRESYDDASNDFNFLGRFNHDRNSPSVGDTVGGTTAGQIYGNPEIFYQIIHTHASFVGDGNVSASAIDSGNASDGDVLAADGSGGAAFEAVTIPDGAITSAKLADDAVTSGKVADDAVHGNSIVDNTIPTAKYGNATVTTAKIADDAITAAKLADDAVTTASIDSGTATDGHVLTADGSGGVAFEAAASGGGGGGGVSIGDSIGTYRLVNSYTTNRMYASTVPVPAAADGDLLVITFAPDDSSPDNAIGGSEVAFVPLANVLTIPNAYTGSGTADSEGSNRDSLRTGFGQNDWLYLGVTALTGGNLTIGSTDAKYAGVFTFRLLSYGTAAESGEESPGSEGVAEKTPDLVTVVLWQWFEDAVTPIPDNPGAHWRFDDEWDGTTPESSDGGGWFTSRGAALDDANLNPDFSQSSWTLWIATEQVRRRVVNDEYSYTDGGYSLISVFDDQYSANSNGPWTTTYDEDTHNWMRMRNSIGEYTPAIAIGNSLEVSWETFMDAVALYMRGPQSSNSNTFTFSPAVDISGYDAILLQLQSFDTNNDDGPHDFTNLGEIILNRPPDGWPVESEENSWITDGTYQFLYDARENTPLQCFLIDDGQITNLVDSDDAITSQTFTGPGIPNSVRDTTKSHYLVTAGRFKLIGTGEDNVTKIRVFDNPANNNNFNRARWWLSGLRGG